MKKSLFARLIGTLMVLAVLAVGFAPAASAAPVSVNTAVAAGPVADDGGGSYDLSTNACGISGTSGAYAASSPLLPVNRWADATSNMHSRLDNVMMADTAQLLQRNAVISGGMSTGNFMWSLGTGMSAFAINFCMLDSMGGAADKVGATIGEAVLKSGLLAALVVIAVAVLLFQARRRGGAAWKTIIAKGAIVGLLGLMVAGAMGSTGGGKDGSTAEYKPGLMSPGWIVTTLNKTVSSLASAPAAALAMPETASGMYDTGNPLSCGNYITSLKTGYQSTHGTGADKLSSGVPMIMSTLWEGTGLQTWRTAQFGKSGLDANTYCHLLDWNSGAGVMGSSLAADQTPSASTVRGVMGRFWDQGWSESFYNSKAWQPTDTVSRDRSMIGWSACRIGAGGDPNNVGHWSIQDTFKNGDSENKVTAEDCKTWFTQVGDVPGAMNWPSNGDDVTKRTSDLALRDYILTLHGNYNYQGITSVFAYNLSAVAMLGVFGAIAISIIVAKIAMVIMIITAFFLVIMCLLPSAGMDKLSGFVKMLLGMNIFVFGIQMIFALVAVLTKMLQSMGATFLGGDGSLFATLWTGLSPLLAVYLLHMMFTKVMKVPSPFQLSAGLAWGASAAAVGGAAAAGVGSLMDRKARQHGARAMGAAKRVGGRGLNGAMSAASGGRLGKGSSTRRGAAAPVGASTAGAGGSAKTSLPAALGGRRGKAGVAGAFGGAAVAAGMSHENLMNSNVANSETTRGKMSAEDRKVMAQAAKDEQAAAIEWESGRRAELGLSEVAPKGEAFVGLGGKTISALKSTPTTLKNLPGSAKDAIRNGATSVAESAKAAGREAKTLGMEFGASPLKTTWRGVKAGGRVAQKAAVAAKYSNAADQFRQKPLRTSAKVLGVGAALALTAPALAIPAMVAGGWAAKKGITALHQNTAGRAAIRDDRTQAYREAMRATKGKGNRSQAGPSAGGERRREAPAQGVPAPTQPVRPSQHHNPLPSSVPITEPIAVVR